MKTIFSFIKQKLHWCERRLSCSLNIWPCQNFASLSLVHPQSYQIHTVALYRLQNYIPELTSLEAATHICEGCKGIRETGGGWGGECCEDHL